MNKKVKIGTSLFSAWLLRNIVTINLCLSSQTNHCGVVILWWLRTQCQVQYNFYLFNYAASHWASNLSNLLARHKPIDEPSGFLFCPVLSIKSIWRKINVHELMMLTMSCFLTKVNKHLQPCYYKFCSPLHQPHPSH